MVTTLKLLLTLVLPILLSVFLYNIDEKTFLGKYSYKTKQIIYGVLFGVVAIISVELGEKTNGSIISTCDATVLSAGLLFGGPAGVIAGLLAGIQRLSLGLWGMKLLPQISGIISTVLAGFIGVLLRKYMFDNKKPSVLYALIIAITVEVLRMMMIFFTNMSDVEKAFSFVQECVVPMVTLNALSLVGSVFAIKLLSKDKMFKNRHKNNITSVFQKWLLLCVFVAFLFSVGFTLVLQQRIFENDTDELLELNIVDVVEAISDASDKNLLEITHEVVGYIKEGQNIKEIAKKNYISEINLIGTDGVIYESTYPDFVNYNMVKGAQSGEFLVLLNDTKEMVQDYQPTSYSETLYRKYAGVALEEGGFVQVGYDADQFQKDIAKQVVSAAKNRHVGESGSLIIADSNLKIVSDGKNSENEGKNIFATGLWIDKKTMHEGKTFEANIYGEPCYAMYMLSEGYYIISVLPKSEAVFIRNLSVYVTVFIETVIFAILFILVYILIKKLVVNNVRKINESLSEITGGNLDVVVDVRSNEEFASLSDDINTTVLTLKHYIDDAAARIDEELKFAKDIQHSALPSIFPPYPERKDFEIYATMHTAKEVGGDFYDFFFADSDKLAFLIADVSGKGIPAAMFMMSAKSLIKGYAESGRSVDEAFTLANDKLCEGNDAMMFVTAWMGIIDLKTGEMEFANAGHNAPLLKRADGSFEYLKSPAGLVLAGMEGIKYRKNTVKLMSGDRLYLYTDGVTEATDINNELYGEDRLLEILNKSQSLDTKGLCEAVKKDVDLFVGEAPQFDDITMLSFDYIGKDGKEIKVTPPTTEDVVTITEEMESFFEEKEIPMKVVVKMNIALDEIFSNIVKFANATYAKISFGVDGDEVYLGFEDDGVQYNPLEKEDADITATAENREIGGLGILMVKKSMDGMEYKYENSKNTLILKKKYM